MAEAPTSRERMLEAAESLLRGVGFAGMGIKQVVAESGAPIGSVYHHFPDGKTQLAAEALRIHGEKARRLLDAALAEDLPLATRLRRFFGGAAEGFDRAGGEKGCAIGAVTLDLDSSDVALRRLCGEIFEGWVETIASHLPWSDEDERRSFAEMTVLALEGAFVLGRAHRTGDPFVTAGEWLAAAAAARTRGDEQR